jgi:hypothetical protein
VTVDDVVHFVALSSQLSAISYQLSADVLMSTGVIPCTLS